MNNTKLVFGQLSLAVALTAAGSIAQAKDYVVQIGAFKYPPAAVATTLSEFGEVMEQPTDSGLTRILVGTFDSHSAATSARDELRSNGYPDAFVTGFGGESSYATSNDYSDDEYSSSDSNATAVAEIQPAAGPQPSSSGTPSMSSLSEEEKLRAVVLDGRMMMKVGDEFLSLEDYRARY